MSSPAPTPDAITKAVGQISSQVTTYAPAVIVAVQAAEASGASGSDKKQAVLDGILAGAKAGETSGDVDIASISALVDLAVSIFNALGIFKHSNSTPA